MLNLKRVRIGTRLGIGFGMLLLLLGITGAMSLSQASHINRGARDLAENWLPSVQSLGDVRAEANRVRRTTLAIILQVDAEQRTSLRPMHDASLVRIVEALTKYEKLVSSPEEMRLLTEIKQAWSDYAVVDKALLALSDQGESAFPQLRQLANGESNRAFSAVLSLVEKDIQLNAKGAENARDEALSRYQFTVVATSILIIITLAVGLVIAIIITRSITVPIREAAGVAETVANGDLTSEIRPSGNDELTKLLQSLRTMNDKLTDVVTQVRDSSESIATAAAQVAAGTGDLSQRTEEQAASLQETAASMEQITATVRRSAESARQGSTLATNASEVASRGGSVVSDVVDTMEQIAASSNKASEIINVIEGIAFQTNILALNAAVEAARAGEQGRGFAVVAGEVRALAQRCAAAAKEIRGLITTSGERVDLGSSQVNDAGKTMTEVVTAVRRVTDLMDEIRSASDEQQTGIEQINQAIVQMDEVTQQNAALVEQASAASTSMASQSDSLRKLVGTFRLPATQARQASTIAPTARLESEAPRRRSSSTPVAARSPAPSKIRPASSIKTDNDSWTAF